MRVLSSAPPTRPLLIRPVALVVHGRRQSCAEARFGCANWPQYPVSGRPEHRRRVSTTRTQASGPGLCHSRCWLAGTAASAAGYVVLAGAVRVPAE